MTERPRVHVRVVSLDERGYHRGFEDEIVLEPDTNYGYFLEWVNRAIDDAIEDPEAKRLYARMDIVDAIATRSENARSEV